MKEWYVFDGVDAPEWMTEETGKTFCSVLNGIIPREYTTHGTRYHMLNRYPSGRLYFHLLGRPTAL